MKKSTIIGFSILTIFILCSISYQPIIADEQIESIPIVYDIKITDENCDCEDIRFFNNNTTICAILRLLMIFTIEFHLISSTIIINLLYFIGGIFGIDLVNEEFWESIYYNFVGRYEKIINLMDKFDCL